MSRQRPDAARPPAPIRPARGEGVIAPVVPDGDSAVAWAAVGPDGVEMASAGGDSVAAAASGEGTDAAPSPVVTGGGEGTDAAPSPVVTNSDAAAPTNPTTAGLDMAETRKDLWERRVEIPLAIGALIFLVAYAIPIVDPQVDARVSRVCTIVIQVVWLALLVDYVVRLQLARRKVRFFWHNLLDLAVLALPIIRQLRLLRLVALLTIIDRAGVRTLRGRVVTYATAGSVLVFVVGSLAITNAERDATGATISSVGDAMWFSIATLTTVGYGDVYPVTVTGRLVAVALMLAGLALFGTVTATFASYLMAKVSGSVDAVAVAAAAAVPGAAGAAAAVVKQPEPGLTVIHDKVRWIDRRRLRGVFTLAAMAAMVLVALSAYTTYRIVGPDAFPPALLTFLLGVAVLLPLSGVVVWAAFTRPGGRPTWMPWITAAVALTIAVTVTVVLLDSSTPTAGVAGLAIGWAFVGSVPLAMSFAQSCVVGSEVAG